MDHRWQTPPIGDAERAVLEACTTLGFLAARTERVELLAWVTAVTYREPGLPARLVTTLDVLSGGRAWLGIGAAWFEQGASGLGLPFPPTAERFERLEETLRIVRQVWSASEEPFEGEHCTLGRTHRSSSEGGEERTLRLVAQDADAATCSAGTTSATSWTS